ncbi:MAG: YtxH domain-containing protein [Acidimicrobiales bacterium]
MRMRIGLAIGFGAGYYLGAKAGRERYEELNDLLGKVRRSDAYETTAEKAKAAVDLGVERAREAVEELKDSERGNGDVPSTGTTSTFS